MLCVNDETLIITSTDTWQERRGRRLNVLVNNIILVRKNSEKPLMLLMCKYVFRQPYGYDSLSTSHPIVPLVTSG